MVLQEHSLQYDTDYQGRPFDGPHRWASAAVRYGSAPLLFQVWTDGEGSEVFKGYGSIARGGLLLSAAQCTNRLGRQQGASVVAVGQAFEAARRTPGSPDLYGPDRHHPSVAGSYLGALVFYRFFTGRTGAEATYLPRGLGKQDAGILVRLNGG